MVSPTNSGPRYQGHIDVKMLKRPTKFPRRQQSECQLKSQLGIGWSHIDERLAKTNGSGKVASCLQKTCSAFENAEIPRTEFDGLPCDFLSAFGEPVRPKRLSNDDK